MLLRFCKTTANLCSAIPRALSERCRKPTWGSGGPGRTLRSLLSFARDSHRLGIGKRLLQTAASFCEAF